MRRREYLDAIAGATVTSPLVSMAQEPGRSYRLGVLGRVPPFDSAQNGTIVAMLDALRQRGFIEGKNLTLVVRAFGQHRELDVGICRRAGQGPG